MALSRKNAVRLLALGGAALAALVIAIALGLRARDPGGDTERLKAAPPLKTAAATEPGMRPRPSRGSTLDTARRAPGDSLVSRRISPVRRGGIRQPAPSAVPAAIAREQDPQRRAELLRMHRLATARVHASVLKRRQALLESTIAKAREEGSADERIRQLEGEMAELRIALRRAESDLARSSAASKVSGK